MHFVTKVTLICVLFLLSKCSLHGQPLADASGHWEGGIHAPFGEVAIEIDLVKNAQGEWEGTFSRPAQNLNGVPLSNIEVNGKSVKFALKANQGGGPFDAMFSADGKMSGHFTTSGASVAFDLTRIGDARIEPPAQNPAIGKELEGSWNGTLEGPGTKLRLLLTMVNQPDGTSRGSVVVEDQGLKIPVTRIIQEGAKLTLDFKNVGASYSGSLNTLGTELSGTYTQGPFTAPLLFQRTAP
jgi:hypothetical protein